MGGPAVKCAVVAIFAIACNGGAAQRPASPAPPKRDVPDRGPSRVDAARPPAAGGAKPAPVLDIMTSELARSLTELKKHSDPPYFAAYSITDTHSFEISGTFGALGWSTESTDRFMDVDVRVGDHKLDSTHPMRERYDFGSFSDTGAKQLVQTDDEYAIRTELWRTTDEVYKRAAEQYTKVLANSRVKVTADDPSDDFSREDAVEYFEPPATITFDRTAWENRLRALSALFRGHRDIAFSRVSVSAIAETRYYANSDGTRYQLPRVHVRVTVSATTKADDGMTLHRAESIDAANADSTPSDDQIRIVIERVIADLTALRAAPIAEPYMGPAILEGKAAGVFFHEVFGHRIEGHRQKREDEGQTFAKKIGQPIMPDFMSVYDDPTVANINGRDVNGFYRFDDEGVRAQKASLVEAGVLRTFLLGRSPTRGFTRSNGHGRRQHGHATVARQGNLVVAASRTVERAALRQMLLDQVKRENKPYGLILRELDGGFTMTTRFMPQAFKLIPVMTFRLYPDGREELVRGADLEGTPLVALASITAAGDDVESFNGYCGAESGYIPVSATSPSVLVSRIELAKKDKDQRKPPVLPPPPLQGSKP
jgi:TldD protein